MKKSNPPIKNKELLKIIEDFIPKQKNISRDVYYRLGHDRLGVPKSNIYYKELVKRKGLKTIGAMALKEFEALESTVPVHFNKKDFEIIMDAFSLSGDKATIMWSNKKYLDKVITGYKQLDINSAYPHILLTEPIPYNFVKMKKGLHTSNKYITLWSDNLFYATFDSIKVYANENKYSWYTYFFEPKIIGKNFITKWLEIKKKYKTLAKVILNSAIGAMQKYRNSLIPRYIWYRNNLRLEKMINELKSKNCDIIKINTDSVGYIGSYDIPTSDKVGDYKYEYYNDTMIMLNPGVYQVKGKTLKMGGVSWKDKLYFKNGDIKDPIKDFPAIYSGMEVLSHDKNGDIFKTISSDTTATLITIGEKLWQDKKS